MSNNPFKPFDKRIIVPPNSLSPQFDLEIKIMFNTRTGTTEMRLFSETLKEFNTLQIVGVMSEHITALLRGLVSGSLKAVPVIDTSKGGNDGNKS